MDLRALTLCCAPRNPWPSRFSLSDILSQLPIPARLGSQRLITGWTSCVVCGWLWVIYPYDSRPRPVPERAQFTLEGIALCWAVRNPSASLRCVVYYIRRVLLLSRLLAFPISYPLFYTGTRDIAGGASLPLS